MEGTRLRNRGWRGGGEGAGCSVGGDAEGDGDVEALLDAAHRDRRSQLAALEEARRDTVDLVADDQARALGPAQVVEWRGRLRRLERHRSVAGRARLLERLAPLGVLDRKSVL